MSDSSRYRCRCADVGFGLVIVVVGDEILDRVVGEEALELAIELRGQRLVGREDQSRALGRLDHLGHGEGLARAGDAEQHLVALAGANALDQLLDRLRLVALRLEFGHDAKAPARPRTCPDAAADAAATAGRLRMLGSPSSSSALSESAVTAAPVRPRGWLSGRAPSNFGCGASPNPCVLGATRAGLSNSARCSPSGWTSGREALDLGRRLGPGRFGPRGGFSGGGHERNMGRIQGPGEGQAQKLCRSRLDRGWSSACCCPQVTVRHPGERAFDKLLISQAISRIRESAAPQKDIRPRPFLRRPKGTGNNDFHALPPGHGSDSRRRRRGIRFGAHIDAQLWPIRAIWSAPCPRSERRCSPCRRRRRTRAAIASGPCVSSNTLWERFRRELILPTSTEAEAIDAVAD